MNGYDPRVVANTIIDEALYEDQTVTPMKVGKLIFITDGWHLALEDKPLVNQMPQAWEYGLMYPSVFEAFKKYGSGPIHSY